jgi:hypothetical protein
MICPARAHFNARGFAVCVATSAEGCLVLDGLEHNLTLTKLSLQGEMGMQAHLSCYAVGMGCGAVMQSFD